VSGDVETYWTSDAAREFTIPNGIPKSQIPSAASLHRFAECVNIRLVHCQSSWLCVSSDRTVLHTLVGDRVLDDEEKEPMGSNYVS
jgi:hypothetical protein